jgi:hypothetical protein
LPFLNPAITGAKDYKDIFDEHKQYHRLQLADSTYDYRFTVLAVSQKKPSLKKSYTWYMKNSIQVTQGNYDGKLLHGSYSRFYCKTNLLAAKGVYKYGLKEGVWYEWNGNGTLSSNVKYKKGFKKGKAMFYDSSGNMIEKCRFKNDKKHGKSYSYIDGVEQKPVKYKKGEVKEQKPCVNLNLFKKKEKETGTDQPKEATKKAPKEKVSKEKAPKEKVVKEKKTPKVKEKGTKEKKEKSSKNIFKKKPKEDKP